ncbi:hypothetical protein, partial [Endozoicomonas sp.]|uniref:hypothetical protein n=1 Tax=Endozoicomonas sp. TaxID=1892382 RepID=UPI00383A63C0
NGEPVKSIPAILRVPPEFLVISGSNAAFCQTTLFPKKADYPTNTPPLADPAKPFSIWCQEIGRGNADLTWTTLIANCFKGENLTIDNLIDVIGQKLLSRPNGMDDSTLRNTISYCLRRNECFTDISRGKGQKARGGFWEYTESLAKNINTMDSGQADGLNKAR